LGKVGDIGLGKAARIKAKGNREEKNPGTGGERKAPRPDELEAGTSRLALLIRGGRGASESVGSAGFGHGSRGRFRPPFP